MKTEDQYLHLQSPLLWMLSGAVLLLIPTLSLLINSQGSDFYIAKHITDAWHGGMVITLQQCGISLPAKTISNIMDAISWLAIASFTMGYFQIIHPKKMPRIQSGQDLLVATTLQRASYALFWITLFLILIFVIPFHSRDLYGYINRGVQQAFYQINPYLTPVGDMPGWQSDPMFQAHWLDNPCPYGFFYAKIAKFLAAFGQRYFFLTFLIFKASTLLVHLFNTYLIYRLGILLNRSNPTRLAILYGLNPLIVFHQLANGHNDGFLALGLLAALFALVQPKKVMLTWPLLLFSILTKYVSLLAAPFMLIAAIKNNPWQAIAKGAAFSVVVLLVLAFPYIQDWQHLPWDKMTENAGLTQHSIQSAITRLLYYTVGNFAPDKHHFLESTRLILKKISLAGFVLFYLWRVLHFWKITPSEENPANQTGMNFGINRSRNTQENLCNENQNSKNSDDANLSSENNNLTNIVSADNLLFEIALAISIYLLLASAKFHAWYLGMVLPIIFLLNPNKPKQSKLLHVIFWISLFQLLSFTPLENIHILGVLILIVLPTILAIKYPYFKKKII